MIVTKIALVIDKRGSRFGFSLARLLKQNYDVKLYDIDCFKRDSYFFQMQKELAYEPLIVKEELDRKVHNEKIDYAYIDALEERYGTPFLWPYIWADRGVMGQHIKYEYSFPGPSIAHEEIVKRLQVCFREITRALEEKRPDFIIFETVDSVETTVLYWLAKKMGINVLYFDSPRIKDVVLLTDSAFNQFEEVYQVFDSLGKGLYKSPHEESAKKILFGFRETPSHYRYFVPDWNTPFLKRVIQNITCFWKAASGTGKHSNLLHYLQKRFIKLYRKAEGFERVFEKPKDGEIFAYFPLQVEPEVATMVYAPFFTNQVAVIQNIAKSLPIRFKLYVKEHPDMLYRRPSSYYKELKKLPNVRLIDCKTDSIFLIKRAKLILTISGTAGWEAAMLSKPVITFGSVFYNKLSSVKNCQKQEALPLLVEESLKGPVADDSELIAFLSAILEKSIHFNYGYIWEASLEEIAECEQFVGLVNFLADRLKLIKREDS